MNVTVFLLIHLFLDIQFFDDFLQGALFLSFPTQFFVFSLLIVEYINFVFCGGNCYLISKYSLISILKKPHKTYHSFAFPVLVEQHAVFTFEEGL